MNHSMSVQTKVGIFVIAGVITASLSIFLLGGEVSIFKNYAYIYAELDQVQGLSRGSVVSLAGFTVGNIDDIHFSKEKNSLVVRMRIQIENLARFRQSSVADVRTQGALGDKYIYVTPGDAQSPSLSSGDYVQTAKSTDFMGLLSDKGDKAARVFDIIDEVYKLTKAINSEDRPDKLMGNMLEASLDLKATAAETRKLIADVRGQGTLKETLVRLDSVMGKLDRGDGTLGALINDPTLHDRLKAILGTETRKQSMQSLIRGSIDKSGQ